MSNTRTSYTILKNVNHLNIAIKDYINRVENGPLSDDIINELNEYRGNIMFYKRIFKNPDIHLTDEKLLKSSVLDDMNANLTKINELLGTRGGKSKRSTKSRRSKKTKRSTKSKRSTNTRKSRR